MHGFVAPTDHGWYHWTAWAGGTTSVLAAIG